MDTLITTAQQQDQECGAGAAAFSAGHTAAPTAAAAQFLPRSSRLDVRNPIVGLPNFARLADLPPEARDALVAILNDIALDARERADKCWRTHKAPMAAYWKACSVYAGHIKRALKAGA